MMLSMPFDSPEARLLNQTIFETIYHAALEASCDLARDLEPYPTWPRSPAANSQLQFDLWGVHPLGIHDFDTLKTRIHRYGLRNSLLTAQMPTASTSLIAGVNDGVDPYTRYRPPSLFLSPSFTETFGSNVYVRRSIAGEFQVVSKWLVRDLAAQGLWTENIRRQIIHAQGNRSFFSDINTAF